LLVGGIWFVPGAGSMGVARRWWILPLRGLSVLRREVFYLIIVSSFHYWLAAI